MNGSSRFIRSGLMEWMEEWPEEIVRAKGMVWLATRNDYAQSLSQAGPSIQFGPAGQWAAALTEAEREAVLQEDAELAGLWHEEYGDRINKVVFIGIEMNRTKLIDSLDSCLLSDSELTLDWSEFPDDFPNASNEQLESTVH